LRENKFVFVAAGSAIVAAVALDDSAHPSTNVKPHRFVLSDRQPQILYIPAGYANGFRPLEPCTKIIFFSTATMEEAANDDYRFRADYWGADVWSVESR
jgi:dTDP-4-dehydrorhamnose 3,5-epimerase